MRRLILKDGTVIEVEKQESTNLLFMVDSSGVILHKHPDSITKRVVKDYYSPSVWARYIEDDPTAKEFLFGKKTPSIFPLAFLRG